MDADSDVVDLAQVDENGRATLVWQSEVDEPMTPADIVARCRGYAREVAAALARPRAEIEADVPETYWLRHYECDPELLAQVTELKRVKEAEDAEESARARRQQLADEEKRDRELAAKKAENEAARAAWVLVFGSPRLRKAFELGLLDWSLGVYVDERVAAEFGDGWTENDYVPEKPILNPSHEALTALAEARQRHPQAVIELVCGQSSDGDYRDERLVTDFECEGLSRRIQFIVSR